MDELIVLSTERNILIAVTVPHVIVNLENLIAKNHKQDAEDTVLMESNKPVVLMMVQQCHMELQLMMIATG